MESNCQAQNPIVEKTGIARGIQQTSVSGLIANTEYSCYVLAVSSALPQGVCSARVDVQPICNCTNPLVCREIDDVCIAPARQVLLFDKQGQPVSNTNRKRMLLQQTSEFDFQQIQSAVDSALTGYTIYIGSGTYAEQLDIDSKTEIRLLGPNHGIIAYNEEKSAVNTDGRTDEAIITWPAEPTGQAARTSLKLIVIDSSNDTVFDGLTVSQGQFQTDCSVTETGYICAEGMYITRSLGSIISNNAFLFEDIDTVIRTYRCDGSPKIDNNFIKVNLPSFGFWGVGILLQRSAGEVKDNVIESRTGIQVQPYDSAVGDSIIYGNTIKSYRLCLWMNYFQTVSNWDINKNQIVGTLAPEYSLGIAWEGIRVQTFLTSLTGWQDPFIKITENSIDARTANTTISDRKLTEFENYQIPLFGSSPSLQFEDNTFIINENVVYFDAIAGGNSNTGDLITQPECNTVVSTNTFPQTAQQGSVCSIA